MKNKINFLEIDKSTVLNKEIKNSIVIKNNKGPKNIPITDPKEILKLFPKPKGWRK